MTTVCVVALFVLPSCVWNRAFLKPQAIPISAKRGMSVDPGTGDTLILNLSGPNYQPVFSDGRGNELPLPFRVESVLFGSPDKLLHGWMLKDSSVATTTTSTLLFLHGNGGNILSEYPVVLPFLKQGFQVFVFDYSGYGFSQGKATRNHVIEDAAVALRYVKLRPDVVGTDVVLYGQSLGGHTAAIVAGLEPTLIDVLVIEGGFSSFRKIAKYSTPAGFISKLVVKEGPRAAEGLSRYGGQLLVIHSAEDSVVPIGLGRELYEAGNAPKYWMEISGPHGDGPILSVDEIVAQIRTMLSEVH